MLNCTESQTQKAHTPSSVTLCWIRLNAHQMIYLARQSAALKQHRHQPGSLVLSSSAPLSCLQPPQLPQRSHSAQTATGRATRLADQLLGAGRSADHRRLGPPAGFLPVCWGVCVCVLCVACVCALCVCACCVLHVCASSQRLTAVK